MADGKKAPLGARQLMFGPRVVRLNSGAFVVHGTPDVSPPFRNRPEAEKWLRAAVEKMPEAKRPRLRPCMNCRAEFMSEGHHNRLCGHCRGRADVLGDEHRPVISSRKA